MKAARIVEQEKIEIVEVEMPKVESGQILVKNKVTGICGSDFPHFLNERPMNYPLDLGVPGHECIGTVAESRCEEYKEGDEVLALPTGSRGFAEYITSTPDRTVRLPDLRDDLLVAQPLGTVIHACRKLFQSLLHPERDERKPLDVESWKLPGIKMAIVGQGSIGLLFTSMMKLMEAETIIGIDPVDYRLEASTISGATHTINCSVSDSVATVREITNGRMLDLAIEAVGKDSTVNDCVSLNHNSGTVLVFGVPRKSIYELKFPDLFRKELRLLGSVGPHVQVDFPPAVTMIANNKLDVSHMISHRMPLDDIQEAFEMAICKKDNAIKILLQT